MALHDELADLRAQVGPQVFNDPVAFRAAFDDFVPEGSASTGEVSLLVGAIATGALDRLKEQLALGADPETSIAVQGDLLARDRGTTETHGARWALSVLAHALGAIPSAQVLTRPTAGPDSVGTAERPSSPSSPSSPTSPQASAGGVDTGPTQPVTDPTRVVPDEPRPAAAPEPSRRAGRGSNPLMIGAVVVLAIVAVVALVLLLLRDGDSPDDTAADRSTSTADGGGSSADADEEVVAQLDMSEEGKTVRLQLVHDGTDADLVMLVERDGDFVEVDRVATSCPYLDTSYDAGIEDVGRRQIFWGWQDNGNEGFGEYGEVQIDEEMLIPFDTDAPCPSEG